MSFMSKFYVQGKDAGALLNRLSTNNVDGDTGMITYTQWLDGSGHMQADLTVTKLKADKFMVVATDTMHRHVETWMERHIEDDLHCHACVVTDVTAGVAQINVQGPKAREVMAAVTSADMSDAAFPFRAAKTIDVGCAELTCCRIT